MKNLILGSLLVGAVAVTVAMATGNVPQTPVQSAPTTESATPVAPPPDIVSSSPLGQIIRLTQAGVDQGILMTYVTNSTGTFNLDSDRIIYLTNLGVPNGLITAMMQRDQQLQQQFADAQAAQQQAARQPQITEPAQPPPAPATTTEVTAETQPAPVTIDYFNDTLSPYGTWVDVNGYGRCWRPTVCVYDSTWQPYCDNGQWVYTDCGWYWNSSYAWGATFHYGRWFRDASVGWCWYPDNVWAPSWVTWRYSDNYCGWAPLPPRTYCQSGVGIVYNGVGVGLDFSFGLGASCFTFVPVQHFCDPHPRNFCAAPAQVTQIYNRTKVINNIKIKGDNNNVVVNNGIAVQNVAAATHAPIREVPVHTIDRSFTHDGHKQFDRQNAAPAQTVPARFGSPTRASSQPMQPEQQFTRSQNHDGNKQDRNNFAQTAPQNPATSNFHSPEHSVTVQSPAANFNSPSVPARWQQPETPRNTSRNFQARQNVPAQNPVIAPPANYSAPQPSQHSQNFGQSRNDGHQNYSQSSAAPQQNQNTPSSGYAQSSGGRNQNQVWGMR